MKIIIQEMIKGTIEIIEDKPGNEEKISKTISLYITNGIPFNVTYGN